MFSLCMLVLHVSVSIESNAQSLVTASLLASDCLYTVESHTSSMYGSMVSQASFLFNVSDFCSQSFSLFTKIASSSSCLKIR